MRGKRSRKRFTSAFPRMRVYYTMRESIVCYARQPYQKASRVSIYSRIRGVYMLGKYSRRRLTTLLLCARVSVHSNTRQHSTHIVIPIPVALYSVCVRARYVFNFELHPRLRSTMGSPICGSR